VLTQEDWDRLDEEHFKEDLTFGKVLRVVPWAASELPRPVREDVFAKTDPAFQLIWHVTRRRFARQQARAFQHCSRPGADPSEPVLLAHPREPRGGERDLPLRAQPDGVVRVPAGEVPLPCRVSGHRQEEVNDAREGA
jgi:hypothetical protein